MILTPGRKSQFPASPATPALPHQPVTKHRCANVILLLRDSWLPWPWRKCLSLWLNQLAAQFSAWARCEPKENNIPHWQAPSKSLAHTWVCFVCSDYLRSRHFFHRQELGLSRVELLNQLHFNGFPFSATQSRGFAKLSWKLEFHHNNRRGFTPRLYELT